MTSFILDKAHEIVRDVVSTGDLVVDATVGNGWDTLFLARLVGPDGSVVGFDVQASALDNARQRLQSEGVAGWCRLHEQSHSSPWPVLRDFPNRAPKAIMFNLGYLPGGDKSVTTDVTTTVAALDVMAQALASGGVLSVVAYRGHPGALEECESVEHWMIGLSVENYTWRRIEDPNGPAHAPVLFVVRKR